MSSITRRTPAGTVALAGITFTLSALLLVSGRHAEAEEELDKTQEELCHKACDDLPLTQVVQDGAVSGSGTDAAAVLLGCHGSCELVGLTGGFARRDSLHWNENLAVAMECSGANRIFHIPCTDAKGVWALNSEECPALPTTFRGQHLQKPVAHLDVAIIGELKMWRWKQLEIPDKTCGVYWADQRAHDKGCSGALRIYHVRCERSDGNWSTDCDDRRPQTFLGKQVSRQKRLGDKAWSEVAIEDPTCGAVPAEASADWADTGAHKKDCRGSNRIYHVRCERPDGNWSTDCPDMPVSRLFRGATLASVPIRLEDRSWTEAVVPDPTCTVGWADERAHRKDCDGPYRIYHVRCERSGGGWSIDCADMEKRLFRGLPMMKGPSRLGDRAWTEVGIPDATCQ